MTNLKKIVVALQSLRDLEEMEIVSRAIKEANTIPELSLYIDIENTIRERDKQLAAEEDNKND